MSILKSVLIFLVAVLAICSVHGAEGKKKGDQASYIKRTGAKFLAEVAARPEVYTLKSGMLVEVKYSSDSSLSM